jgi:hypothetical protein
MFGLPFPKARPNWLLGSKGRKMELDGYCESLGLAFEYHGQQHYQSGSFFQPDENSLRRRKRDDMRKARLCSDNSVHLITIPYTTPLPKVPELIFGIAQELGFSPLLKTPAAVKVADFVLPEWIAAMQFIAKERGGDCLSTFYINNNTKLRWRCAEGHEWDAVPGSIQQGRWCPRCVGKLPPDEAYYELQEIAASRGGRCLSAGYVDGQEKLLWQCASGHKWEAAPNNVRGGSWCHECAKRIQGPKRLGLEMCQQAALAKGGKCLSNEYVNSGTKLTWQCAEGHDWNSTPDSVVRLGTWCPSCMGKRGWETRLRNSQSAK